MSRCFAESPSIRRTLTEMVSSVQALALLLDFEDEYEFISPAGNRFDAEFDSFLVNDELDEVDVDVFLEAVIARRTLREVPN